MQIGPYTLAPVVLAPMAGITDAPFRRLVHRLGAGMTVSEMISANPLLADTDLARWRRAAFDAAEPRTVQIVGHDPSELAWAAQREVEAGAQIIDINMGCPAQRVCHRLAGSALLRDEARIGRILDAVIAAVAVPVTLKIRTGWDHSQRNAVAVARLAERCGVAALTVHGRTRACGYRQPAEHDTLRAVRDAVGLTLIANGDIDSPERAAAVLAATAADGVMIGRAALSRPWLPGAIARHLAGQPALVLPPPELGELAREHLHGMHQLYGPRLGVLRARKHVVWYCPDPRQNPALRLALLRTDDAAHQVALLNACHASRTTRSAA